MTKQPPKASIASSPETGAGAPAVIRQADAIVTPEMVWAGMDELRGYEPGGETAQETVIRIYLAMREIEPGCLVRG